MHEDKFLTERINHLLAPRFNYEWITLDQTEFPDLIITTGEVEEKYSNTQKVIINVELSTKDTYKIIKICEKILIMKKEEKLLKTDF